MKAMKRIFQRGDSPPTIRRSPRQLWWGGLFISSLIAMGSTFEAVWMQRYYSLPNSTQRWAVGSITTVFLLTFTSLTLQMIPQTSRLLMGTKLELALIVIVSAFTCAAVGTATNPATGMAVNALGGVSFGNLYYSTWTSFGCGLALLLSFMRTERGLDVSSELKLRGKRFRIWVILIVTTFIVMGSSASAYDAKCGVLDVFKSRTYCRRAAFGVSAGCIGCVGSLAVVAMRLTCSKTQQNIDEGNNIGRSNQIIFVVECISSLILVCFYCFAVAYLTGEEGPGAPLGNLYYATWISFGLVFFAAASCFEETKAAKSVYSSLRNDQQGVDMGEGGVTGITMSNHGRPIDWIDHNENNNTIPLESNQPEQQLKSSFSQAATSATSIGSIRSGSVGEVQVGV